MSAAGTSVRQTLEHGGGLIRVTIPWAPVSRDASVQIVTGASIKSSLRAHAECIVRSALTRRVTMPLLDSVSTGLLEIFGSGRESDGSPRGNGALTVHDTVNDDDSWTPIVLELDAARLERNSRRTNPSAVVSLLVFMLRDFCDGWVPLELGTAGDFGMVRALADDVSITSGAGDIARLLGNRSLATLLSDEYAATLLSDRWRTAIGLHTKTVPARVDEFSGTVPIRITARTALLLPHDRQQSGSIVKDMLRAVFDVITSPRPDAADRVFRRIRLTAPSAPNESSAPRSAALPTRYQFDYGTDRLAADAGARPADQARSSRRRKFYTHQPRTDDPAPSIPTVPDIGTTIRDRVNPGTTFRTTMLVENLTSAELGALLWLLSLPDEAVFGIGRGKPLGFGAVHVACDLEAARVFDANGLSTRYHTLTAAPQHLSPAELTTITCAFDSLLAARSFTLQQTALDVIFGLSQHSNAKPWKYPERHVSTSSGTSD